MDRDLNKNIDEHCINLANMVQCQSQPEGRVELAGEEGTRERERESARFNNGNYICML